jgi:ABC-type Fe3+/spermidine/putrescine transport system ATPase subunit
VLPTQNRNPPSHITAAALLSSNNIKKMVKFGLRLSQNRAAEYPPEAYMDYDKLKEIIHDLKKKKLAR